MGSPHFKLSAERRNLAWLCIILYYYYVYIIEYCTDEKGQTIDLFSGCGVVGEHDVHHKVADI